MNEKVLTIEKLVSGGDGLARPEDDAVVFVPGVVPGDRVRVELSPLKRGFRRGRLLEVMKEGPARRDPACSLAGTCGGCQWLHVAEEAQAAAVDAILEDALSRVGRIDLGLTELLPAKGLSSGFAYRRRVRLQLQVRGDTRLGFHRARSHEVLDVPHCAVLQPELEAIRVEMGAVLSPLSQLLRGASQATLLLDMPAPNLATAELRVKGAAASGLERAADLLLAAHPQIKAVAVVDARGGTRYQAGEDSVAYEYGTRAEPARWPAWHSPGGFLQASREGNSLLLERVLESELITGGGASLLELYSGSGNFTIPLAEAGLRVTALEREGLAHENARRAAAVVEAQIDHAEADAARWLADRNSDDLKFDQVLLDPPRVGAAEAVRLLPRTGAQRIAYVSCDAVTLARDAASLVEEGYHLKRAEPLLLFPQTSHFETLAIFERGAGGS